MTILDLMGQQSVVLGLSMVVGAFLKRQSWYANGFIPVATFLTGVIGAILAPAVANAAGLLAPGAPVAGIFAIALGNLIMATGVHSSLKNTVLPALKNTFTWLAAKWLQAQAQAVEEGK